MTTTKWIMLVTYLLLAGAAVTYAGTRLSSIITWSFILLGVVHLLEFVLKFRTLQNAGGSMPGHFVQTMLFGIAHWRPLER